MSRKNQVLAEIAELSATLPEPGPNAHLQYIEGPEQLGRVMGRNVGFLISADYSKPIKVRRMLADIRALGG